MLGLPECSELFDSQDSMLQYLCPTLGTKARQCEFQAQSLISDRGPPGSKSQHTSSTDTYIYKYLYDIIPLQNPVPVQQPTDAMP